MKDQKWFNAHIGKRIYRDDDCCGCPSCNDAVKNGLVVKDEGHARYLFEMQNEWGSYGTELNYRDEK